MVVTTEKGPDAGVAPKAWGILGGTFDPIHLGHLAIAERTRETLDLAGIVFVPAAQPPHKQGLDISPASDRVAMVELAVAGHPCFRVSRVELEREGPSYTVDTLEALHADGRYAGGDRADPVLVLSVEALRGLPGWHRPERILELCRVAVVPRRGYEPVAPGWLERTFPGREGRFLLLDGPDLGHSASDIRARAASGRSIRYLVPDTVADWILRRSLYGTPGADGGRWTR
jgi:nicotinate-nucleotide adenylyltransferase